MTKQEALAQYLKEFGGLESQYIVLTQTEYNDAIRSFAFKYLKAENLNRPANEQLTINDVLPYTDDENVWPDALFIEKKFGYHFIKLSK